MRRIITILAVGILIYLFRRLQAANRVRQSHPGTIPPGKAGRMVRDRICNTFLPAESALTLKQDGSLHYFCSSRCRDRFLQEPAS